MTLVAPHCTGRDPWLLCQTPSTAQKEFITQQPKLSWVFTAGGHLQERTWKSDFNDSDIYGCSDESLCLGNNNYIQKHWQILLLFC